MAVQKLQDWTVIGSGSTTPAGTIPIDAGTNRCIIYAQTWEFPTVSGTVSCNIGGIAADGRVVHAGDQAGDDAGLQFSWWNEISVQAMSAQGSSNLTVGDKLNFTKRNWAVATFASVDQDTLLVNTVKTSASVSTGARLDIATPGEVGDYVILLQAATGGSASATFNPVNFIRQFNAVSPYVGALADSGWASTSATMWTQFAQVQTHAAALVLEEAISGIAGSGSADGIIAVASGVGLREITGVGSAAGTVVTVAGSGDRLIIGAAAVSAVTALLSGTSNTFSITSPFHVDREVHMDDQTYGFEVTLHENPSNHAERIKGFARKGVTMESDFHSSVYLV